MTDKEELIKALAIAIACLKSKTFDDGIIGDLEEVLKKNTEKDNEKIHGYERISGLRQDNYDDVPDGPSDQNRPQDRHDFQ